MITRLAGACAVAALVMSALVGCSTPTEPAEPTPSFTSEAQAFAAAEETYRAYVDALNQVDLSDPATFEPVFALTTGDLNSSDRTSFSEWHAEGFTLDGDASVPLAVPASPGPGSDADVAIAACYDVSQVDVRDSSGVSVVRDDRPAIQKLEVELFRSDTSPTGLVIGAIGPSPLELDC